MTEVDRLVRRLRGLTPRAWQAQGRSATVRRLATDLAAIGAPGRTLPELPDHALADVVAVLAADAAAVDPRRTAELVAAAWAATS